MPCKGPEPQEILYAQDKELDDLAKKNIKLERMLCLILSETDAYCKLNLIGKTSSRAELERFKQKYGVELNDVSIWWNQHKIEDKKRKEHEDIQRYEIVSEKNLRL